MAGKRRPRQVGQGMTPLFALEPFAPPAGIDATHPRARPTRTADASPTTVAPTPVSYRITGHFHFASGEEQIRSVDGHTISTRMEADIVSFLAYLRGSGWLFADGRAVLANVLTVLTEEGQPIPLSAE
jgi:hypothetical protein